MLKSQDFDYDLPEELIAHSPSEKRDHSRLLIAQKEPSFDLKHQSFFELVDFVPEQALLILNDTKVISARIPIQRHSGGKGELLIETLGSMDKIRAMGRPSKRLKVGERIIASHDPSVEIELLDYHGDGWWDIQFLSDEHPAKLIERIGELPLPPYIERKEGLHKEDNQRYQTVFAQNEGSTAAPTASLHFTESMLKQLQDQGIRIYHLTHHVGAGTFLPVKTDRVQDHQMHCEFYTIPNETAKAIAEAKANKLPIIAAGTTVLRALESAHEATLNGQGSSSQTELFIYPPYNFKVVDHLITNFHLPKSTLLMLVSAFLGFDETMELYRIAVEEKYRFFSFGDAMYLKR